MLKFGQIIGFATEDIAPGDTCAHARTAALRRSSATTPSRRTLATEDLLPVEQQATFQGFRRANGKAGTRNYIGVVTSVNCSATVARFIAEEVDALGHARKTIRTWTASSRWCTRPAAASTIDGEIFEMLKRTTWGYAVNPNMAGVLVVGLGCEGFQIARMKEAYGLVESDTFRTMTIQDTGGTKKTIAAGVEAVRTMLPIAAKAQRETVPASELMLALQCGGSDGYSGITANPALGVAADILVRARRHGGPGGDAGDLWRRASADAARRRRARSARSWSASSSGGRTTPRATR